MNDPVPQVAELQRALRACGDPATAAQSMQFFKTGKGQYGEGDRFLGIRVPDLRRLAKTWQALPMEDIEALLESSWHEARMLALLLLVRQFDAAGTEARRGAIYRFYLQHTPRINNWDLVDCSAEHIIGAYLYSRDRTPLRRLARSACLWERRIAVLATFHFIRRGDCADTLALAADLLQDREDLMHKAVGWMLREVGKRDNDLLETFVKTHGRAMPRTMLRYAIERWPAPLRKAVLQETAPSGRSLGTKAAEQAS